MGFRTVVFSPVVPCTEVAPTGSSTCSQSNSGMVEQVMPAPMKPMRSASQDVYRKHPAAGTRNKDAVQNQVPRRGPLLRERLDSACESGDRQRAAHRCADWRILPTQAGNLPVTDTRAPRTPLMRSMTSTLPALRTSVYPSPMKPPPKEASSVMTAALAE